MSRWTHAGRRLLERLRGQDRGSGIRGAIGDALFACALGSESAEGYEWLQRAIDDIQAHGTEVSLHRGIAGLGLVVAMYCPDEEEVLAYVDEVAHDGLESVPPASMQSGVAGIALYASLRSGAASGRGLQDAVVQRLRATAVESDAGLVWSTPAPYASRRGVDVPGEPVVEYGMVHGIAGTLVGLAALAAQGSAAASELARGAIAGAWAHAKDAPNRFGRITFGPRGSLGTVEFDEPSWCVGDPGVLRSLWLAARTVGDVASSERALAALREDAAGDARRGRGRLGDRLDLCCGSAAVAQVYHRMHRETGEAVFRDANAVLLASCARGYDGLEDTTFAYGQMGVLLALMAADREDDPPWDGMLGMSLPRRVAG